MENVSFVDIPMWDPVITQHWSTYSQIPVEVIRVSVDPIPLLVFKKQSGWFQCNPGEVQYILMTAGVVTYIYFSIYLFFIHKKREKKKTEDVSSIHCYMVHL